ncbi:MAG: hypothetical protein ACLQMF_08035 [Rectinemataceae bacterium]
MRLRYITTTLLLFGALAGARADDGITPFAPPDGRSLAMGGPHAALTDDYSALLVNPAGLAEAPKRLFVSEVGFATSGPIFDFLNIAMTGGDTMSSLQNLFAKNNYKLHSGFDLPGPISFGYVDHGLGFGLFNNMRFVLNMASASSIQVDLAEDVLMTGGYALRFDLGEGNALDVGVTAKGFVRGETSATYDVLSISSFVSDPAQLLNNPYTMTTGIGLDTGLRWSYDEDLAAGLAWRDMYSPALVTTYSGGLMQFLQNEAPSSSPAFTYVKSNLDFGLMWKPRLGRLAQVFDSVVLAMDYGDILDLFSLVPRNAILNLSFGLEAQVLSILYLRAGIQDALLSAGVGIDLHIFTVNFAVYGTELGLDPGDWTVYNMLMTIDFRY